MTYGRQAVQYTMSQSAKGFMRAKISCLFMRRRYNTPSLTLSDTENMFDSIDERSRGPRVIASEQRAERLATLEVRNEVTFAN